MVSNNQPPKPFPLKLSSIIISKNIAYVVKSLITRPKPICLSWRNNEKHNEFLIVFFIVARFLSFAQCVLLSISFVANKSMLFFWAVIKYSPLCHFMMKPNVEVTRRASYPKNYQFVINYKNMHTYIKLRRK